MRERSRAASPSTEILRILLDSWKREIAFYGDVDVYPEQTYDEKDISYANESALLCVEAAENVLRTQGTAGS